MLGAHKLAYSSIHSSYGSNKNRYGGTITHATLNNTYSAGKFGQSFDYFIDSPLLPLSSLTDFSLEFWYKGDSTQSSYQMKCVSSVSYAGIQVMPPSSSSFGPTIVLVLNALSLSTTISPSINNFNDWNFIQVIRQGSTISVYHNGTNILQQFGYTSVPFGINTSLQFGGGNLGGTYLRFDEVRVSNIARSVGVPATEFVNDPNTIALHHFNGYIDDDY